jgi:hypothetical protein
MVSHADDVVKLIEAAVSATAPAAVA